MAKKLTWIIGGAAALLSAGALSGWLGSKGAWRPQWRTQLDDSPLWTLQPGGHEAFQRDTMRIQNELFVRDLWDDAVVDELIALASKADNTVVEFDDHGNPTSSERWDNQQTLENVLMYATERIRIGAPITPSARARLDTLLLAAANHPDPYIRLAVTADLCYAGLVEDPRFLAAARSLQDDPDPDVAANARRQLQAYAKFGSKRGNDQ